MITKHTIAHYFYTYDVNRTTVDVAPIALAIFFIVRTQHTHTHTRPNECSTWTTKVMGNNNCSHVVFITNHILKQLKDIINTRVDACHKEKLTTGKN